MRNQHLHFAPATTVVLAIAAGCGTFEDPAIVIDLRALAMVATPPEQVVAIDPSAPDIMGIELQPIVVCSLIADPGVHRELDWQLTLCPRGDDLRCQDDHPQFAIGSGRAPDPDDTLPYPELCATYTPGVELIPIVQTAIDNDALGGFGGIDLMMQLVVSPADGAAASIYASKHVRFAPQIPAERTANTNPRIDAVVVTAADAAPVSLARGRCVDNPAPLTVVSGGEIDLMPVEPPGVRETYVVPTFDGGSRTFTENLSYQWLAGAGDFSRGNTGGTIDGFGNAPPLNTEWRAPRDVIVPVDVPLWVVQRDERLGASWVEGCIRVIPAP